MENEKPIHEIRFGRIKASIWLNQGKNGSWYSVQVCRLYKDESKNKWGQSDNFNYYDLLLLGKVADLAHTWIYEQMQPAATADECETGTIES